MYWLSGFRTNRALVVAGLLLASVTLAERPVAKPAPGPAPAPVSAVDNSPDVALLRALLYAFEPSPLEIRVLAVEDLALLGDERALNPLAQLVLDPNPAIQAAALRAVSRFKTHRAEEILSNAVRYKGLPEPLRVQALESLPLQGTASAREFVQRLTQTSSYGLKLQETARRTLAAWTVAPTPAK